MGAAASVYKDELPFMEMQLRPSPCVNSTTSCSQYNKERNQSPIRDSANILFCQQTTLTSLHSTPMLTMHVRKPSLIFTANFHHCHLQFWLKPSSHPSLVSSKALCLPSIRQSCVFWIRKARSTQTEWRRTYSCGIVTHCISSACWCALEIHETSFDGRCATQLPIMDMEVAICLCQISTELKFQSEGHSSSVTLVTSRMFIKATVPHGLSLFRFPNVRPDIIYLDQMIPSAFGMPAYEDLVSITPDAYSNLKYQTVNSTVDITGTCVERYAKMVLVAHKLKMFRRIIPFWCGRFKFQNDKHYLSMMNLNMVERLKPLNQKATIDSPSGMKCAKDKLAKRNLKVNRHRRKSAF